MNTVELEVPEAVRDIVRRLENSGFETWTVGGAVRDALIEGRGSDWDLATRAHPADVQRLFKRTIPVGIEHGTVGILATDGRMYEITTFRRDVETTGRHAVVSFADTIEEDLARRDFTFNAIAWHPLTKELRDPYSGFGDLRAARLRTVGEPAERFAEDYLRILRGLRFAGHFVLRVDPETWDAMVTAKENLLKLSAERIREELWKILTKTPHASSALKLYAEFGVLGVLYPEVDKVRALEEETGSPLWQQTLATIDALPRSRPVLRLAALLHAVGMPGAKNKNLRGEWKFIGHEVRGAREAETVMRRLKASNADTERVSRMVAVQSDLFPPDAPDAGVRRWLLHVKPDEVRDLFRLRFAMCRAQQADSRDLLQRWRHVHRVMLSHPAIDPSGLAIGGSDLKGLGLPPGPAYKQILDALVQRVIDEPHLNDRERLLAMVKEETGL